MLGYNCAHTQYEVDLKSLISVEEAVELLRQEDVIGLPTETVYGLAGRMDRESALKKIFYLKKRPFFDPLIVHIADVEQIHDLTPTWTDIHKAFTDEFWPGPLTLLLEKKRTVSNLITSGLPTVGVRLPRHLLAQEIIRKLGIPVTAPSANLFKKVSPTTAQHVVDEFKDKVKVVDGGSSEIGIESTVLSLGIESKKVTLTIHRPGFYTEREFSEWAKHRDIDLEINYASSSAAPGQIKAHYQPTKPLILLKDRKDLTEHKDALAKLLGKPFDQIEIQHLYLPGEAVLAARRLYSELRLVSLAQGDVIIFVVPKHYHMDEWRALRDRLDRASSLSFV